MQVDEDAPTIVATTGIWADVVSNVACGGLANVEALIPVGGDPHGYEPSLQDRGRMEDAALVVANGLALEERLLDTLESVAEAGTPVFEVAEAVDTIPYSFGSGHDDHEGHDHDEHSDEESHDEHDDHEGHDHDEHSDEESHDEHDDHEGHDHDEHSDEEDHDEHDDHEGHDHDEHSDEESHDEHDDHEGHDHDEHSDEEDHDEHDDHEGHDHDEHSDEEDHDEHDDHEGHDHDEHSDEEDHDEHDDHEGHDHDEHSDEEDHDEHDDHEGHDHHGHDHSGGDPHVWFDPHRVAEALPDLVRVLNTEAGIDAAELQACADIYQAELEAVDAEIAASVAQLPAENRKLVTNHDALGYYADRYEVEVIGAVIPSPSSMAQTNPAQLEELAELIEHEGIQAIFAETQHTSDDAEALAARVGDIEVVTLYTGSLGPPGSGAETYLGFLRTNTELIVGALS